LKFARPFFCGGAAGVASSAALAGGAFRLFVLSAGVELSTYGHCLTTSVDKNFWNGRRFSICDQGSA